MNPMTSMPQMPVQLPQVGPQAQPAPQAAQAPMFAGNPLDDFNPQDVADKVDEALRSNPKTAAVLDAVQRILSGDQSIIDEQLGKLLKPVNGLVEQVRAAAGDNVADQLQAQIDDVVGQAKSQAQVVQMLPLMVDPIIEKLQNAVAEQGEKAFSPEALEQMKASFEQQIEQLKQQQEMVDEMADRAPELTGKVSDLIEAVAGKLGLRGGNSGGLGGLFGGMLGDLLKGNAPEGATDAQEPTLSPQDQAAFEALLRQLEEQMNQQQPGDEGQQ